MLFDHSIIWNAAILLTPSEWVTVNLYALLQNIVKKNMFWNMFL